MNTINDARLVTVGNVDTIQANAQLELKEGATYWRVRGCEMVHHGTGCGAIVFADACIWGDWETIGDARGHIGVDLLILDEPNGVAVDYYGWPWQYEDGEYVRVDVDIQPGDDTPPLWLYIGTLDAVDA